MASRKQGLICAAKWIVSIVVGYVLTALFIQSQLISTLEFLARTGYDGWAKGMCLAIIFMWVGISVTIISVWYLFSVDYKEIGMVVKSE